HVVDMECVGGKISTDSPNGQQMSYYNYILGDEKSKWAGYVPIYNEVIRHDIYNGIDQRLYFDGSYMRYDFIVAPNSNSQDIILRYNGAKGVSINPNGELVLQTSIGDVVQQKLYAYQIVGNEKKQVECSFVSKTEGNIGFKLENYDRTKPLVIDPLLYSTFIGGGDMDEANKIVLDLDNNPIIVGTTKSTNLPTHVGSYDMDSQGQNDVFVAKFTSDLSDLIFCTYYGGSSFDFATACAVDIVGSVIFGGRTFSNNLPHKNGEFDNTHSGARNRGRSGK
ncbi:MAG: hypothetical protein HYZ54_00330, partial [Ignavibacteriae bacterium]|nr:hypothetical protein [Ignavibacteriota bacterium]